MSQLCLAEWQFLVNTLRDVHETIIHGLSRCRSCRCLTLRLGGRLLRQGVKHVLTHRILMADFYLLETDERPTLPDDYLWIDENRLDDYAIPRLIERLLEWRDEH